MLYEVITNITRLLKQIGGGKQLVLVDIKMRQQYRQLGFMRKTQTCEFNRITSYNVCYTKLLRLCDRLVLFRVDDRVLH